MNSLLYVILGVVGGALGVGVVVFLRQRWTKETVVQAEETAKLLITEAQKEATVIKKEAEVQAKDVVLQAKTDVEKEVRERKREIQQTEKRVQSREETLEKRVEVQENREAELSRREHGFKDKEEALQQREQVYTDLIEATRQRLEQVAQQGIVAFDLLGIEPACQQPTFLFIKRGEDEMRHAGELREDLAATSFVEEIGGDEAHCADALRRAARYRDHLAIGIAREGANGAAAHESRRTGDENLFHVPLLGLGCSVK